MSQLFEPTALVVPFEQLRMSDVESVGGKNASLGEMISQLPNGVRVPTGFAKDISERMDDLDTAVENSRSMNDGQAKRVLRSVSNELDLVEAQIKAKRK